MLHVEALSKAIPNLDPEMREIDGYARGRDTETSASERGVVRQLLRNCSGEYPDLEKDSPSTSAMRIRHAVELVDFISKSDEDWATKSTVGRGNSQVIKPTGRDAKLEFKGRGDMRRLKRHQLSIGVQSELSDCLVNFKVVLGVVIWNRRRQYCSKQGYHEQEEPNICDLYWRRAIHDSEGDQVEAIFCAGDSVVRRVRNETDQRGENTERVDSKTHQEHPETRRIRRGRWRGRKRKSIRVNSSIWRRHRYRLHDKHIPRNLAY